MQRLPHAGNVSLWPATFHATGSPPPASPAISAADGQSNKNPAAIGKSRIQENYPEQHLEESEEEITGEMAGMNGARSAAFLDGRNSVPSPSSSLIILRSSAARKVCFTSASRSSSEAQNAAEEARDGTPKVSDEAKETASATSEKAKDSKREAGEKASWAKEKAKENAEAGKQKVEEDAEGAKEKTSSAAETVKEKTKEGASRAIETAQDFGEKVKQTAQDAWGAAKETTQKIKETVVGKSEDDLGEMERARRRASNDKKE